MGHVKNSARKKRKYNGREAITERNRATKLAKSDLRSAYLIERTESLLGKIVKVRTRFGQRAGVVEEIIHPGHEDYPSGCKRRGARVVVKDSEDGAFYYRKPSDVKL